MLGTRLVLTATLTVSASARGLLVIATVDPDDWSRHHSVRSERPQKKAGKLPLATFRPSLHGRQIPHSQNLM
jgi:hypothetical protein